MELGQIRAIVQMKPQNEEGDIVSHREIGSLEQVYLKILGPFIAFVQGVESDR